MRSDADARSPALTLTSLAATSVARAGLFNRCSLPSPCPSNTGVEGPAAGDRGLGGASALEWPIRTTKSMIERLSYPAYRPGPGAAPGDAPPAEWSTAEREAPSVRRRILVVGPLTTMFAEADVDLLRRHHDVRILNTVISRHRPVASAAAVCWIAMLAAWADLIYIWFADLHAYVAVRIGKALGRPSMVVLGGYEVASVPDLGYGLLADERMAPCVRYILDHADRILAVDEGLLLDAERFLNRRPSSWRVLPTGYDPARYCPSGEKQDLVLTVFWGDNIGRARVKGLDIFLAAAALLPEIRFGVIGACGEVDAWLREQRPPNVEVIPPISRDELIGHYQRAKVYAQFSLREGLPNAVCEAMLCGCVPVGTPVQGITTAMGPLGYYAQLGDPEAGAEAIARALESPDGLAARERIAALFPIGRREDGLLSQVDEVTGE